MFYITTGGVIGIAIAYASQDTLSSLFAGVAILTDAPYKLHDFLVLEDQTRGRVTHIGFRSTRLLTTDHPQFIEVMTGGETSLAHCRWCGLWVRCRTGTFSTWHINECSSQSST